MAKRWQLGPYIVLKSNRKSGTASSFMRFLSYFYFRFGRKRLSSAIFAPKARITLRSWQMTIRQTKSGSLSTGSSSQRPEVAHFALDTTTPITLSVEELTVTDSVPDFSGSPLGPTGFRVFWPKNPHLSTDGGAPWQYRRGVHGAYT